MKRQRFLNWVCYLVLVAFGTSNLTGCSALVLAQRSVTKDAGTETRRTEKVVKEDVEIVLTSRGDELMVSLQHQPHHRKEIRTIKESSGRSGNEDLAYLVGAFETMFLGLYIAEKLDVYDLKKAGIRTKAQTDAELQFHDDDLEPKPWVNATALGAGLDLLFLLMIQSSSKESKKSFTQWKPSGTAPGTPKPIPNHPVSISLPQFQYKNTYHTDVAGEFTIPASDLIGKISNLDPVLDDKRIEVEASTKVDGQRQYETLMITSRTSGSLFQALYDEADFRRKALPPDLLTEIAFSRRGRLHPQQHPRRGRTEWKATAHHQQQGPRAGLWRPTASQHRPSRRPTRGTSPDLGEHRAER